MGAAEKDKSKKTGSEKVVITPEIKRIWIRLRQAWLRTDTAFSNSISMLDDKQANAMYDIVKHSLFTTSYIEIIRKHPELHDLIKSDEDRWCMKEIYDVLSWRLGREEPLPEDLRLQAAMRPGMSRFIP